MTTSLRDLIESAAAKAGGYRALSREIGVPDSHLHNYRKEARKCPLDVRVLIAEAAGLDADKTLREGIVAEHAGTARGARLAEILGVELPPQSTAGRHL